MYRIACLLVGALITTLLFCNAPSSKEEKTGIELTYNSITGSSEIQKDITGSGSGDDMLFTVNVSKADGLWSGWEEIGYYHTVKTGKSFSVTAEFKNLVGTDDMSQGGLMVRESLRSISTYAALRLTQGIYDPVARLSGASSAASTGSTITYTVGDQLYMNCTEQEISGTKRVVDVEVGAKRGDQLLISKKFTITTASDTLYVGIFGADHSTSSGSFSVTNLNIR